MLPYSIAPQDKDYTSPRRAHSSRKIVTAFL
jgi:hypothetical protein